MTLVRNLPTVKPRPSVRYLWDVSKVGRDKFRLIVKRKDGDLSWVVYTATYRSYRRVRPGDVRWVSGRARARQAAAGVIRAHEVMDALRAERTRVHEAA